MVVSFIAAMGANGVIGREGQLPWTLPGDLKRFRATTWGKPIIMGRKTFDSLGRALPGRTNIILTRQHDFHASGCRIAKSPTEALEIARSETAEEAFVIGGSEVFQAFATRCDRLYLTIVDGEFEGDVFFPMSILESQPWKIVHEESCPCDERNPFRSRYQVLQRGL